MAKQVGKALGQRLQILGAQLGLRHATVHLQCTNGGNHHNSGGSQTGIAALDIQELLCTEIGTEACLRDGVVRHLHRHLGGDYGVTSVGDVSEGTAVYECGSSLQRLYQIGLQSILQESRHSTVCIELTGGHRLLLIGIAHDNAGKAILQIGDGVGQAQHCHDFGGNGDVVAVLTGHAVDTSAQAIGYKAKLTVIHIHAALPGDAAGIDIQGVALVDVIIQHSGQQVVGGTDGVEVTGEVEVDILHRNDLCVSAAGGTTLNTEYRTQGRLAESNHNVLADLGKAVRQTDGGGSLTLTGRSGGNGSYENQFAVGIRLLLQEGQIHFGFIFAILLYVFVFNTGFFRDLGNGAHRNGLGNFNITQVCHIFHLMHFY